MRTLTAEQAKLLREHRPAILKVCGQLATLAQELSDGCPHGLTGGPLRDPECPMCRVYYALADADCDVNDLEDDVEKYLLEGPLPR